MFYIPTVEKQNLEIKTENVLKEWLMNTDIGLCTKLEFTDLGCDQANVTQLPVYIFPKTVHNIHTVFQSFPLKSQ